MCLDDYMENGDHRTLIEVIRKDLHFCMSYQERGGKKKEIMPFKHQLSKYLPKKKSIN